MLLNGNWLFQRDGAAPDEWKPVKIPSTFQEHEGNDFHGVGWYRRAIKAFNVPEKHRVLLHFEAAATKAEVWWNGMRLGAHLGGWTPFRFDVTSPIKKSRDQLHELRVRLDEKVGHNTQGFLPIIQPHWGGIWQDVALVIVPEVYIDELAMRVWGNPKTGNIEIEAPVAGLAGAPTVATFSVRYRLRMPNPRAWKKWESRLTVESGGVIKAAVPIAGFQPWSPENPALYELECRFAPENGAPPHTFKARAAFRELQIEGEKILLNGRPLQVRGILNWGYYPPRLAPHPDEARFKGDLQWARSSGFNLMKFCLWMPPRRFLELADEMGMLSWIEYPTWHPKLTREYLPELRQEYLEFFQRDRNHPSVVLRSLTCETGASAELDVIRELYDMAHREIPNAVVEDDSSWISWNRIHDFYDDHPYGNNHTWVHTLNELRRHIAKHGLKPLVLGEAIAADTWFNHKKLLSECGTNRPYWLPGFIDAMDAWENRMQPLVGKAAIESLESDSLRYAMLMRKYQAETFRREIPSGGYVMSVIRDFPLASMGMLDYRQKPKWPPQAWSWQDDTICLLKTENDRRSFQSGEYFKAEIIISHAGPAPITNGQIYSKIYMDKKFPWGNSGTDTRPVDILPGENYSFAPSQVPFHFLKPSPLPELDVPAPLYIVTWLKHCRETSHHGKTSSNNWRLWVFPKPAPLPPIRLHSSVSGKLAAGLFTNAPAWDGVESNAVIVASHFDDALVSALERGGRVLLLPDGQKGSPPLADHWFLRGGPLVAEHPALPKNARDWLIELQHFDLADRVIPEINYIEMTDPVLLLWDTHDLKTVKTHGLVYETRAGSGRLLVSALKHDGAHNAAGRWLLARFIHHLAGGPPPRRALSDEAWRRLKEKLHEQKLDLTRMVWRFKPDPRDEGVQSGWAANPLDASWKEIRIGAHWEGQGYPALDGWAWYRLELKVPDEWQNLPIYLNFEGVDDMYELYVDGQLAARRGDRATRKDTFSEKFSHDLSSRLKPGHVHQIAVRVCDWQGAGGIFRPVTLSTAGFFTGPEIIR